MTLAKAFHSHSPVLLCKWAKVHGAVVTASHRVCPSAWGRSAQPTLSLPPPRAPVTCEEPGTPANLQGTLRPVADEQTPPFPLEGQGSSVMLAFCSRSPLSAYTHNFVQHKGARPEIAGLSLCPEVRRENSALRRRCVVCCGEAGALYKVSASVHLSQAHL